jgi:murein DD-endopeptidase MepM/ murein hydrolase activator NlpD
MPLIKLNLYSSLFIGLLGFVLLSSHSFSHPVKKASEFKIEGGDDEEKKENFDSTFSTAWELYINTWDTDNLNPYLYDFNSFKSPVNICLAPDSNGFVMPVYNTVTSNFGWRKGRAHNGIDIDLETGDTVVTAFDGVVRMSKYYHGYGNMVVVRHPNGLETLYGHLSKVLVEAGQSIKAGEIVGLGGNTGHSYGSHLHFEIRFMGQPIDPAKFISFENFSLVNNEVLIDENLFQSNKLVKKQKNGRSTVHEHVIPVKYHKIKQGDTLSAIARRNKTTVSKLCKLNGLKETSILRLGQKIKVK